jgi:hypothetical protein
MVNKAERIGAFLAIVVMFAVVHAVFSQTSKPAQPPNRIAMPDAALAPDAAALQPDCTIESAKDGSIPEECRSVKELGGSFAAPPGVHVKPRIGSFHPRPAKTKVSHGGGGAMATMTFFALLSVWCLWGWRRMSSILPRP